MYYITHTCQPRRLLLFPINLKQPNEWQKGIKMLLELNQKETHLKLRNHIVIQSASEISMLTAATRNNKRSKEEDTHSIRSSFLFTSNKN